MMKKKVFKVLFVLCFVYMFYPLVKLFQPIVTEDSDTRNSYVVDIKNSDTVIKHSVREVVSGDKDGSRINQENFGCVNTVKTECYPHLKEW